jgi:hypothetical protein
VVAVRANQAPRAVSRADALLRMTVTINMPSRLKSATVTPEMRVSNVPTYDGLHTPYRLWSTPSPFKQAIRAARFAGDRMSIGARASLNARTGEGSVPLLEVGCSILFSNLATLSSTVTHPNTRSHRMPTSAFRSLLKSI